MLKFRLYFDKDAETLWLNDMAAQGWAMVSFCFGFYTFVPCQKGEYIYQIDFTENFNSINESYKQLMRELGIEIVQRWGWWIMLRKPAKDGLFELYTDMQSQIGCYKKIRNLQAALAFAEFCFAIAQLIAAFKRMTPPLFAFLLLLALGLLFTWQALKTHRKIKVLAGEQA